MDILFDLDGTLINPFPRSHKIHLELAKKFNLEPISYQEYIEKKREKISELSLLSCPGNVKAEYKKERMLLIEKTENLFLDNLYPFVLVVLKSLSKKHRLFLITVRRERDALFKQLAYLRISHFFQAILSLDKKELFSDAASVKKRYVKKLIQTGIDKLKTVIVGDTEADILTGKEHGLVTVATSFGLRSRQYLNNLQPDFIIDNIRELPKIIEKVSKA